jgi:DNA-binding beta-propeller fold protein YncE
MQRCSFVFSVTLLVVAASFGLMLSSAPAAARPQSASNSASNYSVRTLPLPDGGAGDVSMDYIAYDSKTNSVWVPGGNTGTVDVVDAGTSKVRQIPGFPTKEVAGRGGGKRILGPTAVSIGEGVVYIGNRGDSTVCAFNATSLEKVGCGSMLDSTPDGVAYVAPTKEVWVTTPGDKSIRVLDSKTLQQKAKLTYEGNPEGYAVDAKRGRFYTNMEDKDQTLAIDLNTHKTLATWMPSCGKEGPHGIGLDEAAGHLFIACSTLAEVMDIGKDGSILSKVDTGDGVDDIHYEPSSHLLYVGAARDAKLTIARADAQGKLNIVAQVPTEMGARNATSAKNGTVFLAHGGGARLAALVVVSPKKN